MVLFRQLFEKIKTLKTSFCRFTSFFCIVTQEKTTKQQTRSIIICISLYKILGHFVWVLTTDARYLRLWHIGGLCGGLNTCETTNRRFEGINTCWDFFFRNIRRRTKDHISEKKNATNLSRLLKCLLRFFCYRLSQLFCKKCRKTK